MLTEQECKAHLYDSKCAGYYSDAEILMAALNTTHDVQHYHEILTLFEVAFDRAEEQYARTKQASTD